MDALLAKLIPLAFGAAISPTILAVVILILGSPVRPRFRIAVFGGGALAVLVVVGIAGLVALTNTVSKAAQKNDAEAIFDLALGLILLALATRTALRHSKPQTKSHDRSRRTGVKATLGLGVLMMSTNITTLVLYIAALKEIDAAKVGAFDEAIALTILIAIAMLPILLPMAIYQIAPRTAQRILSRIGAFTDHHKRTISLTVLTVFGLYLLLKGALTI